MSTFIDELRASGEAAWLDAPMGSLVAWEWPTALRPFLVHGDRSMEESLASLDAPRRASVEAFLRAALLGPAPGPPRRGCTVVALQRWARARGLLWATRLSAALVLRGHAARYLDEWRLDELVSSGGIRLSSWMKGPELAAEAAAWLVSLDVAAQGVRDRLPAREAVWAVDPGPPFTDTWRRLLDAHQALRVHHIASVAAAPKVQVTLDPPALHLEVAVFTVEVPLEGVLNADVAPQIAMAALGGALDFLTGSSAPRQQLGAVLARPAWRRGLDKLSAFLAPTVAVDPERPTLVWEVGRSGDALEISALLCRTTKAGKYQGAKVELREIVGRLGLSPVDAHVASLLHDWVRPPREIVLEALELLAGHPRVIKKGRGGQATIAVRQGALTCELAAVDDGLRFRFAVAGRSVTDQELAECLNGYDVAGGRAAFMREDELLVARCTEPQRQLLAAMLQSGTHFPAAALPDLLEVLPNVQARLPVQLDEALRGRPLPGDPRPVLQLRMEGRSLVIQASVRPLPDADAHDPGEGPETLHVVRNGQPGFFHRSLSEEPAAVLSLLHDLSVPDAGRQGAWLWAIDDPERALDVVRAVDPVVHRVEIDASLPGVVSAATSSLKLVLTSSGVDWFAVDGHALVDGAKVPLAALLDAVRDGRRYVPLGKDRYVHIADALYTQMTAFDMGEGELPTVGAVHAPLLQQIEDQGGSLQGPASWRAMSERLTTARGLEVPLPDGLLASLRPYQADGFAWLVRQAAWAPGAVLADDMGLGKTVQTIALLLRRRDEGPTLVIAPTSVVHNWAIELERFAPSLRVARHVGASRQKDLATLGPGDVLLTTYGVMLRDVDILAERTFGTLVLDEAQAIKGAEGLRVRAARRLQAGFVVALSGTPVENNATELWSLFSVVVPRLLGPLQRFRLRFLGAHERRRRAALAQVAGPFMLRRTKRLVAPELPEREEVNHVLALSDGHRGLYRQEVRVAMRRIREAPGAMARFVTGQELMRLRQLSCDPRLADPGSPHEGPKVAWLRRMLQTVRDSGEQALVFSTYVSLLELARPALEADGLRVAWLTGSTPAAARANEVDRFQAGEADVFLISLRAGGTGLNLTAASYVFILDPWFNPAAEDQAADRAHRIGQKKKVTIYRGVAEGTVESKILELHAHKRDLVDALMDGSGSDAVLSPAELLLVLSATGGADTDADASDQEQAPATSWLAEPSAEPAASTPPKKKRSPRSSDSGAGPLR